jgi:hypothetical protein
MPSILVCEPRSNTPAKSELAHHLPGMLRSIEAEWRLNSWASSPERQEHALLCTAHLALGQLLELFDSEAGR